MVVPLFGDLAQWLTVEVFWVSHRETPKLFRTYDSINWTCLACLFSLATLWMCKVRTKKSRVDGIKKTLIYSPSWERKDVKPPRHRFKRKKEVWDGERTRTGAHWTQPCVSSYRVRRCLWKSVQMACLSTTKRELPIQSSCAIIYSISLLFLKWWTQTSARLRPVVDRSRTKSTYPIETICFYRHTKFLVSKFHLPPPLNVACDHGLVCEIGF